MPPTLKELIDNQKQEQKKSKPFFRFKLDIEEQAKQDIQEIITQEVKEKVLVEIDRQLKILITQGLKGESIKGDVGPRGERGLVGSRGKDGISGKDGRIPVKGIDYNDGKDGKDGRDAENVTGILIRDLLQGLVGQARLDASAIKNLPQAKLGSATMRGGGASVRGPEIPTGTIDGVNAAFTTSEVPKVSSVMLFVNGAFQREGSGQDFTMSGRTISFVVAPPTNSNILCVYRV